MYIPPDQAKLSLLLLIFFIFSCIYAFNFISGIVEKDRQRKKKNNERLVASQEANDKRDEELKSLLH